MLYRVAVETGLRAAELRSLTRASFSLDATPPTVTVKAAYSKHRREDVLPLRPDTPADLRAFLAGRLPAAQAFRVPTRRNVAPMLRPDLEAAGMPYRDESGRVADFHALRHTFITNLANSGVHPKTAQALARHSTVTLTMDRYSHTYMGEQSEAVAALPDLTQAVAREMRATGTDDAPHLAEYLASDGGRSENATDYHGRKASAKRRAVVNGKPDEQRAKRPFERSNGGEGGIRTPGDHNGHAGFRNRSDQPLWHLSAFQRPLALVILAIPSAVVHSRPLPPRRIPPSLPPSETWPRLQMPPHKSPSPSGSPSRAGGRGPAAAPAPPPRRR